MFQWVLNTPFICNANQLTGFYLTGKLYRKVFSKQAIEIWILIPIIPQNMFKLHAKKIYTKYVKIWAFSFLS